MPPTKRLCRYCCENYCSTIIFPKTKQKTQTNLCDAIYLVLIFDLPFFKNISVKKKNTKLVFHNKKLTATVVRLIELELLLLTTYTQNGFVTRFF